MAFGQLKGNFELCFIVPKDIALCSWGCGGAVSPPVGPGLSPGGAQRAKPLEDFEVLHFTVPR